MTEPDHSYTSREFRQLEEIAAKAKTTYINLRREHREGYVLNRKYSDDEYWFGVAEFLQRNALDPVEYIEVALQTSLMLNSVWLAPNELTGKKAMGLWEKGIKHIKEKKPWLSIQYLNLMLGLYKAHVTSGRSKVMVLLDPDLYFNDGFRYAMAKKEGYLTIAEELRENAMDFLRVHTTFRDALLKAGLLEESDFHVP